MAKRELIERERLINELTESSKHHAQTSREESLLYRDRQIVREQPTITEQDIVKPYLEKLKADIEVAYDELDDYDPDTLGTFASRIDDLIDNLLSESEDKE